MITIVGSQKGGVGKSTLICSLAVLLQERGSVCLVDADSQGTLTRWIKDRDDWEVEQFSCKKYYKNISKILKELDQEYDHVVVDVAGRDSEELRTGLAVADFAILPLQPSQPDIDTLETLNKILKKAKSVNPKLVYKSVFNIVPSGTKELMLATDVVKDDYPELQLSSCFIRDRKVYRETTTTGLGVSELTQDGSARAAVKELQFLIKDIYDGSKKQKDGTARKRKGIRNSKTRSTGRSLTS